MVVGVQGHDQGSRVSCAARNSVRAADGSEIPVRHMRTFDVTAVPVSSLLGVTVTSEYQMSQVSLEFLRPGEQPPVVAPLTPEEREMYLRDDKLVFPRLRAVRRSVCARREILWCPLTTLRL